MHSSADAQTTIGSPQWLKQKMSAGWRPCGPHEHIPYREVARMMQRMSVAEATTLRASAVELLKLELDSGADEWVAELVQLVPKLHDLAAVGLLQVFAESFQNQSDHTPLRLRQHVLAALVDSEPTRHIQFWRRMAQRNDQIGFAFAGMLRSDPFAAAELVGTVLGTEGPDRLCAMHLSLAVDSIPQHQVGQFVSRVKEEAQSAGGDAANAVLEWCESMNAPSAANRT